MLPHFARVPGRFPGEATFNTQRQRYEFPINQVLRWVCHLWFIMQVIISVTISWIQVIKVGKCNHLLLTSFLVFSWITTQRHLCWLLIVYLLSCYTISKVLLTWVAECRVCWLQAECELTEVVSVCCLCRRWLSWDFPCIVLLMGPCSELWR